MHITKQMKLKSTKGVINRIHNEDSRKLIEIIGETARIKTTITSPPYFDMKDYGSESQIGFGQDYFEYLEDLKMIFEDVYKITEDDGTLWIIIDTFKRENQVVTLPFDLANKLKDSGWLLQDIIIWKKDKTVPWSSNGFVQRKFEYILFFSKTVKFKYNIDKVRVYDTDQLKKWWIKYPERYNPKGKALDEIWEFPIPVQGSWGNQYIRHFCPLPKEMVATIIEISTDEEDTVLDPFAGSGSVMFQSSVMHRKYIGFELNAEYIKMFNNYYSETFSKSRKEYDLSLKLSNQEDFKNRILALRALKYARLLVIEIDKLISEHFKIYVRIIGPSNVKNKLIKVEFNIIGELLDQDRIKNNLIELIQSRPLSKFGIEPVFKFSLNKRFYVKRDFGYSKTNSHSYQNNIGLNDLKIRVVSNICLNLNEKDYL